MKSNWVRLGCNQPRLIGMMLAVVAVVWSYSGGEIAYAADVKQEELLVNVGESVRIEVAEATQIALADPTIADAVTISKSEILVNGKKTGVTTLNIWEAAGGQKSFRVIVSEGEYPSQTIKEAIGLPNVIVRVAGNAVILEGTVMDDRELQRAVNVAAAYREKVVNLIEVTNPVQVRIRIQVADVRLNALKSQGLEYPDSVAYTMDSIGENVLKGGAAVLGGGNTFATIIHGFSASDGATPNPPDQIDAGLWVRLQMLQRNGDLKILAEPTLVTLSGKEASFLAGGEFPVVIALADSFSVEYKEFGVKMKIKPIVDSKENINTDITAELSAIDRTLTVSSSTVGGGVDIPGLTVRRALTSLQVKPGQTIMIGGLLDHQDVESLRKVPWIGDVPVIGKLFTSTTKDSFDRELLFFVTPDLVRDVVVESKSAPTSEMMKKLLTAPNFEEGEKNRDKAYGKSDKSTDR